MASSEHGNGSSHRSSGESDKLEELVALYLGRLNDGEALDRDQILADHPDWGVEILQDLEVFLDMTGERATEQPLGTLGDYTLRRQIGRGGMGVVYEAWEESIGRSVALKVLPAGIAADAKASTRFMREAQAAGKLHHPNVVSIHAMGVCENTPYHSMEYVHGETLAQILAQLKDAEPDTETPFGPQSGQDYYMNLVGAFADVADGLQHAHSHGVIHRDIKPSNLILDDQQRLRILDFGLAQLQGQESLTASGDLVGTPSYMSPEQAKRRKIPVDHRTDIYSLGATLYEMLTLELPFRGKDYQDTLSQIVERDPRPLTQLDPRIPRDLETVALKCLRKDPGDRYGTAEALGQDLRRFVRGDPIEARPESPWERFARRLWRHWAIVVITSVLSVAALVGLAVSNFLIAQARDEARYDLYVSTIQLAKNAWDSGNLQRFTELLDRHAPGPDDPDLRGWEWFYLRALLNKGHCRIDGHSNSVRTVAWSPEGLLASGDIDGTVKIWDAATGNEMAAWNAEVGSVHVVAWSPSGQELAAGLQDGSVRLWSLTTRTQTDVLPALDSDSGVVSISWCPDGRRLLAYLGPAGTTIIWDVEAGHAIKNLPGLSSQMSSLAWSPDGSRLAAISTWPPLIVVWSTVDWEELQRREEPQRRYLYHFAWSPSGQALAVAGAGDEISVLDARNCEPMSTLRGHRGSVYSISWSPDGERLVSAGEDGLLKVHSLGSDEEPALLRGHVGHARSVSWSPDGSLVASGGEDGTVRVWELGREQASVNLEGEYPATWSPDGRWLAVESSEDETVRILNSVSGDEVASVPCLPCGVDDFRGGKVDVMASLDLSSDGHLVAFSGPKGTYVWDWGRNLEIARFPGSSGRSTVAWMTDGDLLAMADAQNVTIWNVQLRNEITSFEHHGRPVGSIAWSPDKRLLATAGEDGLIRLFDTGTWRERKDLIRQEDLFWAVRHNAIAWSPDASRLACGTLQGEVVIWDVYTGDLVLRERGHASAVRCVAWSPDAERLASGGADRLVKIWDPDTGKEILTLSGHRYKVYSLAWDNEGQRLMSADDEPNSVRIWDARPGYDDWE